MAYKTGSDTTNGYMILKGVIDRLIKEERYTEGNSKPLFRRIGNDQFGEGIWRQEANKLDADVVAELKAGKMVYGFHHAVNGSKVQGWKFIKKHSIKERAC